MFLLSLLVLVLCVQQIQGSFVVDPADELFAIIGGNACAETLPFGPVAITTAGTVDGKYEHFLSTNTPNKNVVHDKWTQVVTSDGETELFRIYWTFSLPGTLSELFFENSIDNRYVSWRVVEANTNQEHVLASSWLFGSREGKSTTFDISYVSESFSKGHFLWGAYDGVYISNTFTLTEGTFWGVGNYEDMGGDNACSWVRHGYEEATYYPSTKVYMYMSGVVTPNQPSATPTLAPTAGPIETLAINAPPYMQLFAVLGGASCAENLPFGPQAITKTGSADGQNEYFLSTLAGREKHNKWLQIVADGDTELFRIYWSFSNAKSVAERISDAVSTGEKVSYVATASGYVSQFEGTWWFSSSSGINASTFDVPTTQGSFSRHDGLWGAADGSVDGGNFLYYTNFWGVGNLNGVDNVECNKVFIRSNEVANLSSPKTYMYAHTTEPDPASFVTVIVQQHFSGMSYSEYKANKEAYRKVFAQAIATTAGINEEDIYMLELRWSVSKNRNMGAVKETVNQQLGVLDNNYLRSSAQYKETLGSDSMSTFYAILVEESRGLTRLELCTRIKTSVFSDQFTPLLRSLAAQENLTELMSAESFGYYIEDEPFIDPGYGGGSGKKEAVLTVPMIIGIAIGGFALLLSFMCCLARCAPLFALYHCLCPCNKSVEPQEDSVQATAPPLEKPSDGFQAVPTELRGYATPEPFQMTSSAPPQKYDVFKTANKKTDDFTTPAYGEKAKPGPPQKFDVFKSSTAAGASGAGAAADGDINSFFYGASASNNTSGSNNSYHGLFGRSAAPRAEPSVPVPAIAVPVSGGGGGGNGYAEVAIVEAYEGKV